MGHPDYDSETYIKIFEEYVEGLKGIETFSHFHVIYHQNCYDTWKEQRQWPEDHKWIVPPPDPRAGQGVFTIRAPCRPGRLGSSVVELVKVDENKVIVKGLDAIDGSPVMDLKIYLPKFDSFPNATIPSEWKPGMPQRYSSHNAKI
jgi:tRNA-Thr(GGU) m(6)t(6)A37 methyltransferase TsaA